MAERKLTTAGYLVLGLVESGGSMTPYELKTAAAQTVANFWSLPHTQIYAQCDRLAEQGLLAEKREDQGRRRRAFSITPAGRKALDAWLKEGAPDNVEYRDLSMLKLFFGADPQALAEERLEIHKRQLAYYEELERTMGEFMTDGMRLALDAGLGHEREFVRFWRKIARDG